MKRKNLLATLLIIALIGILAACQPETVTETAASETAIEPGSPAVQTENISVLAEGEVVPLFFADLSFQAGGQVVEVLIEEGDEVTAGTELIRVDDIDIQIALAQAEARIASAQAAVASAQAQLEVAKARVNTAELGVVSAEARLAATKAGPRAEEIEAAELRVAAAEASIVQAAGQRDAALNIGTTSAIEAARAQVIAADSQVTSLQSSYDNIIDACFETPDGSEVCPLYGPVEEQTRAQLAAARASADAARAQLNQLQSGATPGQRSAAQGGVTIANAQRDLAEAQLQLAQAGATPQQIRQAEVAVTQAQTNVEISQAGVVQAEAAVAQAEAGVVTAQAGLESAQAALARTVLVAPFDGTVARINISEGQIAAPGAPMLVLADLSGWLVETTDLTELDVAKVEVGSTVDVSFDAIPDTTIQGEVVEVALVSGISQGDVVYEVTISLEGTSGLPVRWGMTTFIDVEAR